MIKIHKENNLDIREIRIDMTIIFYIVVKVRNRKGSVLVLSNRINYWEVGRGDLFYDQTQKLMYINDPLI